MHLAILAYFFAAYPSCFLFSQLSCLVYLFPSLGISSEIHLPKNIGVDGLLRERVAESIELKQQKLVFCRPVVLAQYPVQRNQRRQHVFRDSKSQVYIVVLVVHTRQIELRMLVVQMRSAHQSYVIFSCFSRT